MIASPAPVTSATEPVPITPGDAVALTERLVAIDSRNPSLCAGGPGEAAVAHALADVLTAWGFRVELHEVVPGRPNVIARIGPAGRGTLMFNGHLDVVGTDGMIHAPFVPEQRHGRLYGRGSTDMKAGVAAMCAAAWAAAQDGLDGEILIAAVIDEEYESLGTRDLVARGIRADAAIVTEPTRLCIMPAHRGFVWHQLTFTGRAAHGSRWELGVDAIRHAALVMAELARVDAEELPLRSHPLLGRPSLHASTISGGTGWSTYPDSCVLKVERRTIPGETADDIRDEVERACARVRAKEPSLAVEIAMITEQDSSDVPAYAPIVRALADALEAEGERAPIEGMSAWTDCAILNRAGIPAICFGPGDIMLAHAAEEYVALDEIPRATRVLTRLAKQWFAARPA
jgi:acetylornithine deacetylase